jgi:Ca2+/H+ antiporter
MIIYTWILVAILVFVFVYHIVVDRPASDRIAGVISVLIYFPLIGRILGWW